MRGREERCDAVLDLLQTPRAATIAKPDDAFDDSHTAGDSGGLDRGHQDRMPVPFPQGQVGDHQRKDDREGP